MSGFSKFTNGGLLKFIFCTLAIILAFMLLNHTYFRGSRDFQIVNTREFGANLPVVDLNLLEHSNESDAFMDALKSKYGSVKYSNIYPVSTEFSPEEEKQYQLCVKSAANDMETIGSKFWAVQQKRRSHHQYLKKEDAVMIEVGGNRGDDATEFVKLYNPRYLILEPLEEYANILTKKFKDNPRVTVVNLGLGAKNEVIMVNIEGNNACATSKFSGKNGNTPLYVVNTTEFLLKVGVGMFDVDLMTMNCEGCEYEALEQLLSTNLISHFRNIQFATHSTIKGLKDPYKRYCRNIQLLSRTHSPTYRYNLIWESWRRKDLL